MKLERTILLVLGLIPAVWCGWLIVQREAPMTAGLWAFSAYFLLPGIAGLAAAVGPQSLVDWFWDRLMRLILGYFSGGAVLVGGGFLIATLAGWEASSGWIWVMLLVFLFGTAGLLCSIFGSNRAVQSITDHL